MYGAINYHMATSPAHSPASSSPSSEHTGEIREGSGDPSSGHPKDGSLIKQWHITRSHSLHKPLFQTCPSHKRKNTMPSAIPQLYQYAHVQETQEDLDWADRKYLRSKDSCSGIYDVLQYQQWICPSMAPQREMPS